MLNSRLGAYGCLLAMSLAGLVEGQSEVSAVGDHPLAAPEDMVILTYDVGDLILDVPDHPYFGSMLAPSLFSNSLGGGAGGVIGGMGGGGFMAVRDQLAQMGASGTGGMGGTSSSPSRSTKITMEDLTEVLISVVAPDTWSEVGGPGELESLGTSLVIRQTADVHEEVQDLLDQLREGSGKQKTVAIDARWLLLNSDELEELMPASEDGQPRIDGKVLGEFTRRPSSIRGQTNCFTGQSVYLVSGTRRNVVTSFIPVVGSLERPQAGQYAALPGGAQVTNAQTLQPRRSVGYQPIVSTPNLGMLLQIRPTLVPSDNRAIVDLNSTLTVLGKALPDEMQSGFSPQDTMVPSVDRVAIETQELATTMSVPLGEPVLAGGLTYVGPSAKALRQGDEASESGPATEAPQLYLILELK